MSTWSCVCSDGKKGGKRSGVTLESRCCGDGPAAGPTWGLLDARSPLLLLPKSPSELRGRQCLKRKCDLEVGGWDCEGLDRAPGHRQARAAPEQTASVAGTALGPALAAHDGSSVFVDHLLRPGEGHLHPGLQRLPGFSGHRQRHPLPFPVSGTNEQSAGNATLERLRGV